MLCAAVALSVAAPSVEGAVQLTPSQLQRVGQRIWQNECGGTVEGLTSWNKGEDFASLGIGHFIWYPEGKRGPFEESFPPLVAFMEARGVEMPRWAKGPCPWSSKAAFDADRREPVCLQGINDVFTDGGFVFDDEDAGGHGRQQLKMTMKCSWPIIIHEGPQASRGEMAPSFWLQSTFAVSAISTPKVATPPSVNVNPVSPLKKKL